MRKRSLRRIPGYIFLSIASIFSVFPLYFMFVSATNTSQDVLNSRLLPGTALLDNITKLFEQQKIFNQAKRVRQGFWNSNSRSTGL